MRVIESTTGNRASEDDTLERGFRFVALNISGRQPESEGERDAL
jgi:hypothetical protein